MPPKSAAKSTTASSAPKSPPKACRSTRKHAQYSTSDIAQPPAKKIAPSAEGEEDEGASAPKPGRGKAGRGKVIRCSAAGPVRSGFWTVTCRNRNCNRLGLQACH